MSSSRNLRGTMRPPHPGVREMSLDRKGLNVLLEDRHARTVVQIAELPRLDRQQVRCQAFLEPEVAAIRDFHTVWKSVSAALPKPLPSLTEVQALPEYGMRFDSQLEVRSTYSRNDGRLPGDHEV